MFDRIIIVKQRIIILCMTIINLSKAQEGKWKGLRELGIEFTQLTFTLPKELFGKLLELNYLVL